jgi:ribosomal protein S27E
VPDRRHGFEFDRLEARFYDVICRSCRYAGWCFEGAHSSTISVGTISVAFNVY